MASCTSAKNSAQNWPIIWPADLGEIGITEKERNILDEKIQQLQSKIQTVSSSVKLGADRPILMRDKFSLHKLRISRDHSFVVLRHPVGESKVKERDEQQEKIKAVWDCRTGTFWLQKRIFGFSGGDMLRHVKSDPVIELSYLSLPELVIDETGKKACYFEKKASFSFSDWLQDFPLKIETDSVCGLMQVLRKIHTGTFTMSVESSGICDFKNAFVGYPLFHGAISPKNLVYEKIVSRGLSCPKWQLTGFSNMGNPKMIVWTPGWEPPEYIKWAICNGNNSAMFKENDLNLHPLDIDFMAEYGVKRDTWAMGLLIGSLLRRNFVRGTDCLPFLECIREKLTLDACGRITDQSGILKLTQTEMDEEIDVLIESAWHPVKALWDCVKKYLRIDPEKRPTAAEHCVS
jgi:hypothetical protein